MCCFMVSALSTSPSVKFSTYSSTFADVKPRISTVLSNAMGGSKKDTAVGLVVVKTVAPESAFPHNIFLYREWRGIESSTLLLIETSSTLILAFPEYSSNPSNITSTLSGFSIMLCQTSSDRGLQYSDASRSLRRLSFVFELLNFLNLMRKASLKCISDLCASLNRLLDAQLRRIFLQNIVFPIPGRPTTRIFRFLASKISPGSVGDDFSLVLRYSFSCSSLSPLNWYRALFSWIIKSV